jgi:hypothetical protein
VSAMGGTPVSVLTPTTSFGFVDVTGVAAGGVFYVTVMSSEIWVANGVEITSGSLGSPLPLLLDTDSGVSASGDTSLTQVELDGVTSEAIRRWALTGLSSEQVAKLRSVKFEVADLSGSGRLGEHESGLVRLDAGAAGAAWYVDATPTQDEEYALSAGRLLAWDRGASTGIDLLSVVMHELGHELGYLDLDGDGSEGNVMSSELGLGERRLPTGVASASVPTSTSALVVTESLVSSETSGTPVIPVTPATDSGMSVVGVSGVTDKYCVPQTAWLPLPTSDTGVSVTASSEGSSLASSTSSASWNLNVALMGPSEDEGLVVLTPVDSPVDSTVVKEDRPGANVAWWPTWDREDDTTLFGKKK